MSDNMDPPRNMTDADWDEVERDALRDPVPLRYRPIPPDAPNPLGYRTFGEAADHMAGITPARDLRAELYADGHGLERLPEVYGSPHQLVSLGGGYALVNRDTGETVALHDADTDALAAWWVAWKAQAQVAMAALAAVEREMTERCDRAGVRTLHADEFTIIRSSPKPPAWDAAETRALLERAADEDVIDQAALDNAAPLRPHPQHRVLMNLLTTLPADWRDALEALMTPERDEPRIRKVERR